MTGQKRGEKSVEEAAGKRRKPEAGSMPLPKGRARKDDAPGDVPAEQADEIRRPRMENKLPRDFPQFTGRKCGKG